MIGAVRGRKLSLAVGAASSDGVGRSLPHVTPIDRSRLVQRAAAGDALAVGVACFVAYLLRFSDTTAPTLLPYDLVTVALALAWMAALALAGSYELPVLGADAEEYKRVALATVRLFGGLAVLSYAFRLEVSRGYVAIALPLGLVFLLVARFAFRSWLGRERARGRHVHRVLVVGDEAPVRGLARHLHPGPRVGFSAVAACGPPLDADVGVPVVGDLTDVRSAVHALAVDTVAVAASSSVTPERLRSLAWSLEGAGVDLMVAPSLVDVAGPRIAVHPVAGLPLLLVDEPSFSGTRRLLKETLDLTLATLLTVVLTPALLAVAVAVRASSPGPAFFRQVRIGVGGRPFRVWKFRTMHVDADSRLAGMMREQAGGDAVFFKDRHDPRVTPVGRFLRRLSIDELPQLFNVLAGDMSLVGPRPQRPHEVALYDDAMRRRLLVKPGMTGLWQVSGRSDLSLEDSIRLDLYYVENWSGLLDLVILSRTVAAVLRGGGAY